MSEPAGISMGIAARYAQAAFDLAREDGAVDALGSDVDALDAALEASADLRALIASPVHTREEQGAAIGALSSRMGLTATTRNLLALMARNRRLFVLPQLVQALRARIAAERGEAEAEVVTAAPLAPEQADRLARALGEREGRTVRLRTRVDPSLIGGMVVRVGSRQVDTSIRSRLGRLQTIMKEAR